jgi:spermidine synthase
MTALDTNAVAGFRARAAEILALSYGAVLFLSASLLFSIEPMFSKMVLPVLGGSSSVWSIAMVVFQGLLLSGYVYAHFLTRHCTLKLSAFIHTGLLAVATLSLPIAISSVFQTPPQSFVSLWLIGLFLASVGLPCFALSASAPLLQAWFAKSGHGENPYVLYRASNLGSFAVLLAYPFLIEPNFGLIEQSRIWGVGFAALLAAIGACAFAASRWSEPLVDTATSASALRTSWNQRALWIALGFVPSGLLVAVTAHIATDVASGPFLWILPLALYLLTFVLVFTDRPVVPERWLLAVQPASVAVLAVFLLWTARVNWGAALLGNLAAFFVAGMVCHAHLYRIRPRSEDLTEFYALLSLGGVLGGIFAALVAPVLFESVLEYPLLAFAALFARADVWQNAKWRNDLIFVAILAFLLGACIFFARYPVATFSTGVMALSAMLALQIKRPARMVGLAFVVLAATSLFDPSQSIVTEARSFYGVYKVANVDGGKFRVLYHGTTAHGAEQVRDEKGQVLAGKPAPLSYYYPGQSFSRAVASIRERSGGKLDNVALVGLGIGTLTCFRAPGEHWTIYELDPLIANIARNPTLFRAVSSCAGDDPIVIGDGRLTLREAVTPVDLLLLDIFSSDSVPTHMLTREAFSLYKTKLTPHGAIAFNISNHNMELASVVAASAAANGMATAVRTDPPPPAASMALRAEIAVVARSDADLHALHLDPSWRVVSVEPGFRTWTDDYSDVLGAILRRTQRPN